MKRILWIGLLIMAGLTQAETYQCPSHIDPHSKKDINQKNGWEVVTGKDATGNGFPTDNNISAILMSGKSVYDILYPDEEGTDDSPPRDNFFYTVEPNKFPVWVMCSYPKIPALYFKQVKGDFKKCTVFTKNEDSMICE